MTEVNLERRAIYTLGIEVEPDSLRAAKRFVQRIREMQQDVTRVAREETEQRVAINRKYVKELLDEDESYSTRISAMRESDSYGIDPSSREERTSPRGAGTKGAEDLARQRELLSAQRAGFDRYFGGSERQAIESAEVEQSRLQLQVKARREYVVKVEEDVEGIVEGVARQVNDLLDHRDLRIMELVRRQLVENRIQRNNAL
ncbi:hypothetical protein [Blastopirellula marina]|uniref:Uncharacterized protein n=1 Tax=Blastopirellula marina DSM 3645 TaxID=314230 RepID=A3ZPI5_9BACT|nr:hypothetical protein [Blastopirellula marina]EAQ81663.1 hypothetical protein DSM3645_28817 [Blastopirellula marina DSM 3645]